MNAFTDLPADVITFLTAWLLAALCALTLLMYRIYLRHKDQHFLGAVRNLSPDMHPMLQQRISRIDRWGVILTASLVVYTTLILAYAVYRSLDVIGQLFDRLLSLV